MFTRNLVARGKPALPPEGQSEEDTPRKGIFRRRPDRGYTLMEVIGVVVILAVLGLGSFFLIRNLTSESKEAVAVSNIRSVVSALQVNGFESPDNGFISYLSRERGEDISNENLILSLQQKVSGLQLEGIGTDWNDDVDVNMLDDNTAYVQINTGEEDGVPEGRMARVIIRNDTTTYCAVAVLSGPNAGVGYDAWDTSAQTDGGNHAAYCAAGGHRDGTTPANWGVGSPPLNIFTPAELVTPLIVTTTSGFDGNTEERTDTWIDEYFNAFPPANRATPGTR